MANIAEPHVKNRRGLTAHDRDVIDNQSSDTIRLTGSLLRESPISDAVFTDNSAMETSILDLIPQNEPPVDTSTVPDLNPFIEREARIQRGSYMTTLSAVLYVLGFGFYLVRLTFGNMPDAPLFVPVLAGTLGTASLLLIVLFRNSKWQDPAFAQGSLVGAGIIAFGLTYYGVDDTLGGMYFLTLLVPMIFLSLPWAVFTVVMVSTLSVIPYIWGPTYSDAALVSHIAMRIPIYFIATLAVSLAFRSARAQWREAAKHRRLTRDLTVLQELTTYIASTHNIKSICDTVVDHLHSSFGYGFISIYLWESDKLRLITQHGYEHGLPALPLGKGIMSRVATSGKPVIVRDAKSEPDFIYNSPSIRCEVCVPILQRGGELDDGQRTMDDKKPKSKVQSPKSDIHRPSSIIHRLSSASAVLGVINLEDTLSGALGEADLNLLTSVASALSVALENATLMQESQEQGERLALVNEVAHSVAAKLDLPGVLYAARERLQALVPVDRATLSLLTEDAGSMEIAAVEGLADPNLSQKGSVIPIAAFEPASVLEGKWLKLPILPADSPYPFVQRLYEAGIRSHLSIPLLSGDRVVGLFALSSYQPNTYTSEHIPLFESIAPHLATAVQNAQLYRAIKLRAETDNLTGLLNLPTFYLRLKELLEMGNAECGVRNEGIEPPPTPHSALRTPHSPVSVVMLDLDQFKSYNDSFGHVAGDSVLRQVAALIKKCLGPENVAARYGGDEFALILPGLRANEALEKITQVCETIGRTPFQPEDDPNQPSDQAVRGVAILSASAGIASYPDNGTDAEELVHLADSALYEAKRRGRNRAHIYRGDSNSPVGAVFRPEGQAQESIVANEQNGQQPSRSKRFRAITDTDPELDAYEAKELRAASDQYLQAVYAMASAIELRDGYTHGHVERVAFYAVRLGEALNMDAAELAALRIAGLLHDIGKLTLPHEIAHNPGKLTEKEWEMMRRHPMRSEEIVRPLRTFAKVWPMISAHHENYDGSGYPHGLAGNDISLGGRILRIADTYEVMTVAGRPHHKRAKSPNEAVAELKRCAGLMFDPELVEVFIQTVVGDPTKRIHYNPETHPLSDEFLTGELAVSSG